MNFPYSSIISTSADGGDFLLFRRPEIPVTIIGAAGRATFIGLVDTGSDNTIFPKSVADNLGIPLQVTNDPDASVFGGNHVRLLSGEAILQLESEGERVSWSAPISFFESSRTEEIVILGHSGFLDYFTATFDGALGMLTLVANDLLPRSQ